jgi:hypothetical protein
MRTRPDKGRGGQRGGGYTDNDQGSYADPVGQGRGGQRGGRRGGRQCSDSDSGPYADPANQGRRC